MFDTNDAKSVQVWVQQNRTNVFHFQEIGIPVVGKLTGSNMPFTIGIQNGWQRQMMLMQGHHGGVVGLSIVMIC